MKVLGAVVTVMVGLAFAVFGVSTAQATVTTPKATGSIVMSGPVQAATFEAFQSSPVHGSISYTNFTYPAPGSGVWVPDNFAMGFGLGNDPTIVATYQQTVTGFTPTSPTAVTFAGTGNCGCGWHSTFTGTINGSAFNLSMTEINDNNSSDTYALTATGTIAAGGSVTGSWSDNYPAHVAGSRTGTFAIASIGHEVLHYATTTLNHVTVIAPHDAYFDYAIPASAPAELAGVVVYVHVYDGGSPGAGHDHWQHGTSPGSFTDYPITSGNLTVFPTA